MRRCPGQSLVEVIVAMGFFAIAITTVGVLVIEGSFSTRQAMEVGQATAYLSETGEALRSLVGRGWSRFAVPGTHGLSATSTFWAYDGTSDVFGKYTRSVEVEAAGSVYRDCFTGNISTATSTVLAGSEWAPGEIVSSLNLAIGAVNDLDVDGNTLAIAANSSGSDELHIYDVSDPANPVFQGSMNYGGDILGMAVDDNLGRVYLATSDNAQELAVVDITTPSSPSVVGSVNLTGSFNANDVVYDGTEVYLSRQAGGGAAREFYVIDASSTSTPAVVGELELGVDAFGMSKRGTGVFVATADNSAELRIIDVITPSVPASVGSYNDPGNDDGSDVFVSDDSAYLATQAGGDEFVILNVAATSTPSLVGSLDAGGTVNALSVDVSQNYAYLATGINNFEFRVVDISTPSAPSIKTSLDLNGDAFGIDFRGFDVFLGTRNGAGELQVARGLSGGSVFSNAPDLEAVMVTSTITWTFAPGRDNLLRNVEFFTDWGASRRTFGKTSEWQSGTTTSTVVVSNDDGEIRNGPLDEWNPGVISASLDLSIGAVNDLDVDGNTLAIAANSSGSDELHIYDVSDPANPVFQGSMNYGGDILGMAVDDNLGRVYLATSDNAQELAVVDITTPSSPSVVGSVNLTGSFNANDVVYDGTEVYLSRQAGGGAAREFYVIDASSTSTPAVVGELELGVDAFGMSKRGTGVFVATADNSAELRIIDVITPSVPASVGSYNDPGNDDGSDVFVSDDSAYLATQAGGDEFVILNVAATSTPSLVGSLDAGGTVNALSVDVSQNYAYLATGINNFEFRVVDISTPSAPSIKTSLDLNGDAFGIDFRGFDVFLGTRNGAGELQVARGFVNGWPSAQRSGSINLGGNIDGSAAAYACGLAFVGTLQNGSGPELYLVNASSSTSPSLFSNLEIGASVNEMWLEGDRLYLATNSDSQELVAVSMANPASPSLLFSVDIPGTADAQGVAVRGRTAYVTLQNNPLGAEFYVVGVDGVTPSILGSYEIGNGAAGLALATSTAFLATSSDTQEILALDISNSAAPGLQGGLDVSGINNGVDIALDPGGQTAYLVRDGGVDFITANVANPASMSQLGGLSLAGTLLAVASTNGSTVFVGGTTGGREIQMINAANPASPVLFGQIDADADVPDLVFAETELYAATEHNSQELQIYRAGVAGGLFTVGSYESPNLDFGASSTISIVSWTEHIRKSGQTVRLQIKTAPDAGGVPGVFSATWSGPDGDEDGDETDFFTQLAGELINPSHAGDRFLKFRVFLNGDGTDTPFVHDVTFTYTPW